MNRWVVLGSMAALAAGSGVLFGAMGAFDPVSSPDVLAVAEPVSVEPMPVRELSPRVTGSALSTAAFGLSALQPETYNGEIVLDIIEASPLDGGEKDMLAAKLLAAEAGQGELPRVLADIRSSLAVE